METVPVDYCYDTRKSPEALCPQHKEKTALGGTILARDISQLLHWCVATRRHESVETEFDLPEPGGPGLMAPSQP